MNQKPVVLCLTSLFKGNEFLVACKAAGARVFLVTSLNFKDEPWAKEALEDIFFMEAPVKNHWDMPTLIQGLGHFLRHTKVDAVVPLEDFDVEKAAHLREHFRISGMGQTTGRYFRDKLAMRTKAENSGLPIPAFSALFHDADIADFARRVSPPWLVKPRAEASATGIRKVHSAEELWNAVHELGEHRDRYLVEQFKPGDVYHVDALTVGGEVIFSRVSQYLNTPMEVAHQGGVFRTHTVAFGGADDVALTRFNTRLLKAFGLQYGASHTEFIKVRETGEFVFLETSCRVGGAHIVEMVDFSSGINLWEEWAKIEVAMVKGEPYVLPPVRYDCAGVIISLARQQHPDTSHFNDPEIIWRMKRDHHVGMIVTSPSRERVLELLEHYMHRIYRDFHASAPIQKRAQV